MSDHESTYVPKTGVEKWLDSRLPIVRFAADYAAERGNSVDQAYPVGARERIDAHQLGRRAHLARLAQGVDHLSRQDHVHRTP